MRMQWLFLPPTPTLPLAITGAALERAERQIAHAKYDETVALVNQVLEAQADGVPHVDAMLVHAEKARLARLQGALAEQRTRDQAHAELRHEHKQQESSFKSARDKYSLPHVSPAASLAVKGGVCMHGRRTRVTRLQPRSIEAAMSLSESLRQLEQGVDTLSGDAIVDLFTPNHRPEIRPAETASISRTFAARNVEEAIGGETFVAEPVQTWRTTPLSRKSYGAWYRPVKEWHLPAEPAEIERVRREKEARERFDALVCPSPFRWLAHIAAGAQDQPPQERLALPAAPAQPPPEAAQVPPGRTYRQARVMNSYAFVGVLVPMRHCALRLAEPDAKHARVRVLDHCSQFDEPAAALESNNLAPPRRVLRPQARPGLPRQQARPPYP